MRGDRLALLEFLIKKLCTKTRGMWSATLRENWPGAQETECSQAFLVLAV